MAPSDESAEFRRALFEGLTDDLFSSRRGRADHVRFGLGPGGRARAGAKGAAAAALGRLGLTRRPGSTEGLAAALLQLVETLPQLEHAFSLLDDRHSRELFLELLRFRALGPRRTGLRRSTDAYWHAYRSVDARFLRERGTLGAGGWTLNRYELPGREGPITFHGHRLNVLNTFLLEQYAYRHGGVTVEAEAGDVVIDGGACWGDTSLAFADAVGPDGRVHCFEFAPENIAVLEENLRRNPGLAARIVLHENALWSESGQTIEFRGAGPSTSIGDGGHQLGTATTASIDDLLRQGDVDRVDLVKLDVEGAELAALAGASTAIARWGPKLAVAVYHSHEDFSGIPATVKELEPAYRLFLDHFTVHGEETILFARRP